MNAQAVPDDLDALFEQMMDHLESMLELCSGANREDRLTEIDQHCQQAAVLAQRMMAGRST